MTVENREILWKCLARLVPEDGADNPRWNEACQYAADQVEADRQRYANRQSAAQHMARAMMDDGRRIRNEWLALHG